MRTIMLGNRIEKIRSPEIGPVNDGDEEKRKKRRNKRIPYYFPGRISELFLSEPPVHSFPVLYILQGAEPAPEIDANKLCIHYVVGNFILTQIFNTPVTGRADAGWRPEGFIMWRWKKESGD